MQDAAHVKVGIHLILGYTCDFNDVMTNAWQRWQQGDQSWACDKFKTHSYDGIIINQIICGSLVTY